MKQTEEMEDFYWQQKDSSKKDVCCIYISAMQQISMNVTT